MSAAFGLRTLVAVGAFVASVASAPAFETKPFDAAAFKAAQATGGPVIVHVTAPWCPTCVSQHKALDTLGKSEAFGKVPVFNIDFDTQQDAMKALNAKTQSTIIAFKGEAETGRVVGQTKADAIEPVLQSALK